MKISTIGLLIAGIAVLHFKTPVDVQRAHVIYQHAFYVPIILAGIWFRLRGGLGASLAVSALSLPHIFYDWSLLPVYAFDQYVEIVMFNVAGLTTGLLSLMEERQRRRYEKTAQELQEAYGRLRQTFDQLRQRDRLAALGEISASIAHEIRNPISSILGSLDILERGLDRKDPAYEFLGIIQKEMGRLNKLLTDILIFARPVEPQVRPCSTRELFDSLALLVSKEAQRQRVQLRVELSPDADALVADPDQLKQALLNLLLNGIQAMGKGGELVLSARREAEETVLGVRDEGEGLPEEQLNKIFNPFFTTKLGGSGLGLPIAYQIATRHGGYISVARNADRGMTFSVRLPVERAQPGQPGPARQEVSFG
ncbi:MAG: sensor histidine kinase [Acidobacteria bacterium]|nr:sensor histidine kinase [Acidobacteriota bacterium]